MADSSKGVDATKNDSDGITFFDRLAAEKAEEDAAGSSGGFNLFSCSSSS